MSIYCTLLTISSRYLSCFESHNMGIVYYSKLGRIHVHHENENRPTQLNYMK